MKENEYRLLNTWLDKVYYLFTHDNNLNKIPVEELISLKELATLIQTVYLKFREEYKTLEKLNIGKNNNILDFYSNDFGRLLYMLINEQDEKTIVPQGFRYLTISDFNDKPELSFQNTEIFCDDRKDITIDNIDSRILNGYLDLFEKYYPIFKLYVNLHQNNCLVANGSQYLMMIMDTNNDSLINGLNGIIFNIQNFSEMCNNSIIRLYVDLRNGVNIDFSKSSIIINDSIVNAKGFDYKAMLIDVFENIKFNRSNLEESNIMEFQENQNNVKKNR